ncbi:MAG TPA: VOC family protein [Steroidobacteraceae bacterium]|nr:VOC family protein [Steroidobacteraceae bacterium]
MWAAARNRLIGAVFLARQKRIQVTRWLGGWLRPQIGALDHITIPVRDLTLARRFYCGLLGAEYFMQVDDETFRRYGRPPAPGNGEGSHHISVFLGGETRVDLFLQHSGQPPVAAGHPHIAFHVPPGQMLKWKSRLEAHGIPTEGPLQLGPPGQASLYFNDPFGNHLELTCMGFPRAIPIRPPVPERLAWDAARLR